ncbi:MAG: flagellar protein FliT [Betaproteobacteria bacterium]|jgi:flagellar protein FliT
MDTLMLDTDELIESNLESTLNNFEFSEQSKDMLFYYESVEKISQKMLDAAKRQDWDDLARLEVVCEGYVQNIATVKSPLTAEAKQVKLSYLKKILSNDRATRDALEPWMVNLSQKMSSGFEARSQFKI